MSLLAAPLVKEVFALDFSSNMISALRREMERKRITNNRPQVCDCQVLPSQDNYFDAAFSQFGLMFSPERAKGFSEELRALKPGAKLIAKRLVGKEKLYSTAYLACGRKPK